MPLHDYTCPSCAYTLTDVYRPVTERASASPPRCPRDGQAMLWVPAVGAVDAYESTAFTTSVRQPDGSYKDVPVASLRDIRRIERETEQAHRNGEGQPMRWRDYSNDRSNADVHTFGPTPAQTPSKTTARGLPFTMRKGDQVARDHGVEE